MIMVVNESSSNDYVEKEKERDAYYKREKEILNNFADTINFNALFTELEDKLGIKLKFSVEKSIDRQGTLYIKFKSNNIVDSLGVMKFAFKECVVSSFSCGLRTTAPDYYAIGEVIDYSKDYKPYYWCSICLQYVCHDGGRNGVEIADAEYIDGEWTIEYDKDR